MAKVIHKIKVEVAKPNFFQAIVAKQFDSGSRFLNVTFVDEGKNIEIAKGSTVTINARRSDGAEKKFAGTVNGDGTVTVPLAYWMLELEGKVDSDISVTDSSGSTLTSTKFGIEVERASCKDSGVSDDDAEVDVLIGLIKEVQNVKENYNVEQTYNPTSTNAISGTGVAEALEKFSPDTLITIADTDFIKTSANLINQMTIENGKVIDPYGVKKDSDQYHITDKIYLKPDTDYAYIFCHRVSYFDKDGNFKGNTDLSASYPNSNTFKTPKNFDYAIVNLYARKSEWRLNEGEELLPYEPQHLIINGYRLYDEPDKDIDPIEEFAQWNENFVDNSMPFLLEEDFDTPTGIQDGENKTNNIISYYDELVSANPEYITKTLKTVTTERGTQTLVRYDFIEPNSDGSGEFFAQNKTKIILSSGTHREFAGIYGLYNAMKQITNNPALIDIRRNVHFIVIPVLNPYAVDNGGRTNENGVDIARNFEVGWVTSNPTNSNGTPNTTYGGTAPLTEPESVYLDSVLKENTDAKFYASCHSFQYQEVDNVEKPNLIMWCSGATKYVDNIGGKVADKISRLLREKYADVEFEYGNGITNNPKTLLGISRMSQAGGTEGKQASKYKIQGCTFEVCDWCRFEDNRQNEGKLTDFAILRACEVYINLLLVVCQISNNQKVDVGDIESAFEDYVEKILGGIENGSY